MSANLLDFQEDSGSGLAPLPFDRRDSVFRLRLGLALPDLGELRQNGFAADMTHDKLLLSRKPQCPNPLTRCCKVDTL
jgi:hypothetical protein